ncbi:MAG TPA: DNA mismatch repair protein MutS, partial [Hellea balneolensis]|nr:DNA mismatch repair protein MutS [Hellea balneolensis]
MGGRQLSEDEKRLWQRVAHTVRPLRLAVYPPAVIDKTPSA